jgi:P pilus assembly chaperone PapD
MVRLRKYCKVVNPSKYVVRLARDMIFFLLEAKGHINKSYILPGETLNITVSKNINGDNKVQFFLPAAMVLKCQVLLRT